MKRILTGSVMLLTTALIASGCGNKQEVIQPQTRKLTAAAYASGTLLPELEYKVVSTVDGYLQEAYVKEGDTVHKGQQLFYIMNEVREVQERGAAAVVNKTLPTVGDNAPLIEELRAKADIAQIKLMQDTRQYKRYKNLYEENAVSKSTYEKYSLQYESSQKEYKNLLRKIEQQHLSGKLQLQQAQNQLSVSRAQQNVGRLKSFVDGVVYDVYKKTGDLIVPNKPVALIGAGDMIAKLLIDEDDLEKVYVGQEVLITMDAYDDKVFKAHIKKVYPLLNKVEQSFRVDAAFDEKLPVGIYGLNLEANIVLAKDKEVMVIPRSVLMKGDSVLIKDGEEEKKVHVQIGIADDEWIEVKSGLDKTTNIIVQ